MSTVPPIGHITIIKKNGKDGPIFLLEPTKRHTYTIGSAETNHIRMALPHVMPLHASIAIDENSRVFLHSEGDGAGETYINDEVVAGKRLLADSDVFRIAGRLFRVELGGGERDKDSKHKAAAVLSTPTKALSSRENVPLTIISASPSSTSIPSTHTPTRKPRVSAERDQGNTGSTNGNAQHSSHTSTPTPNRKSTAARTSTSPAPTNTQQRKSRGGGSGKTSMSPAPSTDRKSNGGTATASRRESGQSTPASKKKARSSAPASPANTTPAATAAATTPAPALPSPLPATDEAETEEADKPTDEATGHTAAAAAVEGEPATADEVTATEHTSPQSIHDMSSTDPASSAPYDDMPPFELPYTNGPLTTLLEDPEEEEDPPRPHTRRFLPTPVRKEVETMAATLVGKVRQQPQPVVAAAQAEAEAEEERPARVSVGDGDVCHVDDEIMLSPGTLHRRALQLRHIRYGHVIRELKRKLRGGADTPEKQQPDERKMADTLQMVQEAVETAVQVQVSVSATEAELVQQQEEDMELEELLPSSATTVSVTVSEETVTTVISPTRSSPRRNVPTHTVPSSLPSPLKREIRAGRELRSRSVEQPKEQEAEAAADESVDSAFLPVAEILAHETKPARRHSLPAGSAKERRTKKMATGRFSAAPVISAAERPVAVEDATMEVEEPVAELASDVAGEVEQEAESTAGDDATAVASYTNHTFDTAAPSARKSLPARTTGKRQASRRATVASAVPYTDEPDPASPPASLTTSHSAVPSTPSTPSKPATSPHTHVQQSTPKPLPTLPTPLRRSIRERGAKEQKELVPLLKMPTPLRKDIRAGKALTSRPQDKAEEDVRQEAERLEVAQAESQPEGETISVPEFVENAVTSRHSLPMSVAGETKRSRGQRSRRGTAAAKLAQQADGTELEPTQEEEKLQPTEQSADQEEMEGQATSATHFLSSTGRPSTRRSLPAVQAGVPHARRGGRQTTHAVFSSISDEAASPSSPPADATIAMDGVPPTPASPHKSAAKRQSLRSHALPVEEEKEEEETSVEASAPAFVPVDRRVASRQSMPAGKRREGAAVQSRQSMAPRVQHHQPAANDMEIDEAATISEEQQDEVLTEAVEPIDFHTAAPPTRHSLPASTNTSSASATRRYSAEPTFQYEDAPVVPPPALPSPVRRSIEQRLPRQPVSVRQPLTSPLARDIRRGRALRSIDEQPEAAEQLGGTPHNEAKEQSRDETADAAMAVDDEKAETAEVELTVQPVEQPKRGGRKRKVDIAAPMDEQQHSAASAAVPTRGKRRKPAVTIERDDEAVVVPAVGPTLTSILSVAGSRTRKGKKAVKIMDDSPAEEEKAEPLTEQTAEEETKAETATATKKGRKSRQARTQLPPQSEPVPVEDEGEKSVRRTRRGRTVESEQTESADKAERPAPAEEQPTAESVDERPVATRRRRGRDENVAADSHVAEAHQPTRSRAMRSRAATTDNEATETSGAAATRKSRRKKDDAIEQASTVASDVSSVAVPSTSSGGRSRTRKAGQAHTASSTTEQPDSGNEPATVTVRQTRGRRGAAAAAVQQIEEAEAKEAEAEAVATVSSTRTRKGRRTQQTAAVGEREAEEREEEDKNDDVAEQSVRRARRPAVVATTVPESIDSSQPSTRASRRRIADEQTQQLSEVEAAAVEPVKRSRRTKAVAEQASTESDETAGATGRVTRSRAGRR